MTRLYLSHRTSVVRPLPVRFVGGVGAKVRVCREAKDMVGTFKSNEGHGPIQIRDARMHKVATNTTSILNGLRCV